MVKGLSRRAALAACASAIASGANVHASPSRSEVGVAIERYKIAFENWRSAAAECDRIAALIEASSATPRAMIAAAGRDAGSEPVYCYSPQEIDAWIDSRLAAFGGPQWWSEAERARIVPAWEKRRAQLHAEFDASRSHCIEIRSQLGEHEADDAESRASAELHAAHQSLIGIRVSGIDDARAFAAFAADQKLIAERHPDLAMDVLRMIAHSNATAIG